MVGKYLSGLALAIGVLATGPVLVDGCLLLFCRQQIWHQGGE